MKMCSVKGLAIATTLFGSTLLVSSPAHAQEVVEPPARNQEKESAAAPTTSRDGADGTRFRFGVSGGPGFFTVQAESGSSESFFVTYGGIDLRLGAQINDLVGVYVQPTLGYYSVTDEQFLAAGGLAGVAAAVDVTFLDRFFAGAGLGYTVYNNPGGITPLLRLGAYPLVGRSDKKVRRKGLMLGIDLRFTKLEDIKTIVMPTFNVGYEAF